MPSRKPYGQEPWSAKELARAVEESYSIAAVLSRLSCTVSGTNYRWVHRLVAKYEIDTSHFLGEAWLRGKHHSFSARRPIAEILVENSSYHTLAHLKRRLLREGFIANACARCGISRWMGQPLALQLDHVNGIGDDHRLENIRLLCPNCHSQTDTYCGKNTARAKAAREKCRGRDSNPHGVSPASF